MSAVQKIFTQLVWIAGVVVGFSSLCGASPLFGFTVSGLAMTVCPPLSKSFLIQSANTPVSDSREVSGECPANPPFSVEYLAAASAEFGGVAASATSMGGGAGGGANADYKDTFTLHPLPGFGPGVVFGVTSSYTLTASGSGPGGVLGQSKIEMRIPEFAFDNEVTDLVGTHTGLLDASNLIFTKCPCIFSLELLGQAGAANGGFASVRDPITIELPPGWTYTAASQSPLATPEPVGLLPVGGALLVLRQYFRHRSPH